MPKLLRAVVATYMAFWLSCPVEAPAADMPVLRHRGVTLTAWPPAPGDRFDVTLLPPADGVERLRDALDEIFRRSPSSARAIETLSKDGPVTIAYHPHRVRDTSRLNTMNIALFVPNHGRPERDDDARSYLVVVNQHGIKWPERELAAVLVHELAGHGMQHFRGRFETLRSLDRECEAYLYEERANQDLGLDKDTLDMVQFRRALEGRYCSDFRAYMRHAMPDRLALWDRRNPDVGALLSAFDAYVAAMNSGKMR